MKTITVDTHLHITGLPQDEREAVIARCTFDNPKHKASARFTRNGKPARGIKPKIDLWQYDAETDTLTVPNGVRPAFAFGVDQFVAGWTNGAAPAGFPATTFQPRDYQVEAAHKAVIAGNGIIVAGTGTGKTVIGLMLAHALNVPTLFIVHTSTLLEQTRDRVRQFLGIEPGVIGGGAWDVKPFTVAMVQTLAERPTQVETELAPYFGCVILDEAHHCPAETFARVIQRFPARYRFGLTATPDRADGLGPMLEALIGPIVYRLAGTSLPLKWSMIDTGFVMEALPTRRVPRGQEPDLDFTALVTKLCDSDERTGFIADNIWFRHRGASLVLTDRVEHVKVLASELCRRGLAAVAMTGATSKADRDHIIAGIGNGKYSVLVSTPGLVGEGFDCPRLDTLFNCTMTKAATKVEQMVGRVTRPYAGKVFGMVFDFVDCDIGPCMNFYRCRARVYKRLAGAKS